MKPSFFVALVVGLVLFGAGRSHGQVDKRAIGTLFIDASDAAQSVTITRHGSVLGAFTFAPMVIAAEGVDVIIETVHERSAFQRNQIRPQFPRISPCNLCRVPRAQPFLI